MNYGAETTLSNHHIQSLTRATLFLSRHSLALTTCPAQIQQRVNNFWCQLMRDLLKLLNDCSAGDLTELNDDELQSFEALCENWRTFAEAERARRNSLPHPRAAAE